MRSRVLNIDIQKHHKYYGVPEYIKGHNPQTNGFKKGHSKPKNAYTFPKGHKINIGRFNDLDTAPEIDNCKGYLIKIAAKKRYFAHHLVWCKANNVDVVPEGYIIHHIDRNKKNNNISNLMLLTPSDHNRVHRKDIYIGRWGK